MWSVDRGGDTTLAGDLTVGKSSGVKGSLIVEKTLEAIGATTLKGGATVTSGGLFVTGGAHADSVTVSDPSAPPPPPRAHLPSKVPLRSGALAFRRGFRCQHSTSVGRTTVAGMT